MNIALLFLCHNRRGIVARCFQSLYPTLQRPGLTWHIVDNASTDGTTDWLLKLAGQFRNINVTLSAANLGVSGGRALLFEMVQADVYVSLDSDVEARDPRWLEKLLAILDDKSIGVTGPGGHFITRNWTWYEAARETGDVDVVSGYCQAFRRDVLESGVAVDLNFGQYWMEDSCFCLQAKEKGYRIYHTGPIGLHHIFAGSGDDGTGKAKQAYLASKYRGKGLVRIEQEDCRATA